MMSIRAPISRAVVILVCVCAVFFPFDPPLSHAAGEEYFDDFKEQNPVFNESWACSAGWRYRHLTHTIISSTNCNCLARWSASEFSTGTLAVRMKLGYTDSGAPPNGGVVFSYRSNGDFRFLTLTAKTSTSQGKMVLGEKIGEKYQVIASFTPVEIPAKRWLTLTLEILPDGEGLDISLAPEGLDGQFFHQDGVPLVPGQVGIRTRRSQDLIDSLRFTCPPDPNAEKCDLCHSGNEAGAPKVYAYWNGSWWDNNLGNPADGDAPAQRSYQQGGHGDPDGKPLCTCTGATGCHDMRQSQNTHRDGNLMRIPADRFLRTANTYHLRSEFINGAPLNTWDVQVTFDNACYNLCHQGAGVSDHRHALDAFPAPFAAEMGTHLSDIDPSGLYLHLDRDLTDVLAPEVIFPPYFAPCISCHDPHGSPIADSTGDPAVTSNLMLRNFWSGWPSSLCNTCHR